MISRPKMTVITCTYYRPDFLRRVIQSVQKQVLEDYEHIVVSDHDPFARYVYEDFKDDKRIKFFEVKGPYKYNLGAAAFNWGISKAKSNYICYALDDDILYENHLSDHYDFLESNKGKVKKVGLSNIDVAVLPNDKRNVEYMLSLSFDNLRSMKTKKISFDVLGLSHIKDIVCYKNGKTAEWKFQSDLSGEAEDSEFINKINAKLEIKTPTALKVSWGGHNQKKTKGIDEDYYKLLKEKLVVDKTTSSGFRMESDTPYVYPELKNILYGNTNTIHVTIPKPWWMM